MTTIIPRGFKPYGSASTPSYLPELGAFCAERGYRVVDSHWVCGDRLANPLHRCTRHYPVTWAPDHPLDHVVRLRHHDAHWSLLSQNYDVTPERFDRFVADTGADHWEDIGPAPYGNGTTGILIVGHGSPWLGLT